MKKLKNIFTSLMVLILTLGVINEVKAQTKQGDFRYEQIFFEGNGGTMYHVRKDGLSTEEGYENYGYLLMDEEPVFCIDASTPYESGSTFTGREFRDGEVISEGTGFKITRSQRIKLEKIAYYGYQSQKSDKNYVYTQMLIWENIDRVARRFTYPLSIEEYRQFKNDVMSKVNNHSSTPSWHNQTHTLKKGQSITLTNTNTSIGELNIPKSKNGYNFKVNGNKLTITATNSAKNNTAIKFKAKNPEYFGTSFIWKKPGEQNMGSFRIPDPFRGVLNLNIQEFSPLEITKVDELGRAVSGVKFKVWYSDEENSKTYTTSKDGKVKIDNRLVGKTIKIQEISVPSHLELSKEIKSIEIKANTLNKVKFINKIKSSTLNLKKVDEDGNAVPGVKFKIWYTNDVSSSKTYTTDSKGLVNIKDLKANREISVQEIEVPNHLVLDKTIKKITIKPAGVGTLTFTNKIKRLDWSAIKVDENDKPIKGAKFEAVVNGNEKHTYISDEKGEFKQTGWKSGTKVTVREIEAPKGYELDPTPQTFILKPGVQIKLKFINKFKPATLNLKKVDEDGNAVPGVKFKIWYTNDISSSKTYTTDSKGLVNIKDLKANREISVQEIEVPNHLILSKEVKKIVLEPEKTGKVEFKNFIKKGNIEILKVSAHDKKIKLEGVEFELLKDGKTIQTKKTGKDGIAVFENVHFGKYQIREKETISGYFKNSTVKDVEVKENKEVIKLLYENEKKPEIKTLAKVNGEKISIIEEKTKLVDEVIYKDLVPGKEYTIKGVLMDKSTNKPLLVNGKEVRAEKTFIAKESNGVENLEFIFNSTALSGKEVVVFERLYKDGKEIAVHTDINDIGQTVTFAKPEIKTLAKVNGEKISIIEEKTKLIDEVKYTDLIPGKEYTIKGVLMDKSTNKPLLVNGKEVRAEKTFTATKSNGVENLEFIFNSTALSGKEVVVFERLYKDGKEIAVHADIKDLGQTVKFIEPKIGTKATIDEKKEVEISQKTELIDEVSYKNLIPGKEYILEGVLMDKKTGKALKVHGKEVTSILTFVPEKSDGVVKIKFIFNSSELFGKEIVVFERLYKDGKEIAVHTDINDIGQTVKFKDKPKTPNTGDNSQIIKTGVVLSLSLMGLALITLLRKKKFNK